MSCARVAASRLPVSHLVSLQSGCRYSLHTCTRRDARSTGRNCSVMCALIEDQGPGNQGETPPATPTLAPSRLRTHQLAGTAAGYREQVVAHGIPSRKHGLFADDDALLLELCASPDMAAFEKHLPGEAGPYQPLPRGGWVTGDEAAARGIDLRMFYRTPAPGEEHGSLEGVVRLGDGASIGIGFWVSAHGGAVESVLDEATAELAKCEFTPVLATVEANFRIKKAVPLHTTLRVECRVVKMRGIRCWVDGRLTSPDRGVVYAECAAQLVNISSWL
ncbi:hypothetical protein ACKKBF_B12030 [Auxenochlorella protothecoides x Auxenochlorella symbiontica]